MHVVLVHGLFCVTRSILIFPLFFEMDSNVQAQCGSSIEGYYIRTSTSPTLVVILRFVQEGADTWAVLPQMHGELLPFYTRVHSRRFRKDVHLFDALSNMQFAPASDPNRYDKTQSLRVPCRLATGQTVYRECYRCYTTINIPTDQINSFGEEDAWIKSTLPSVLSGIRDVLNSPSYND